MKFRIKKVPKDPMEENSYFYPGGTIMPYGGQDLSFNMPSMIRYRSTGSDIQEKIDKLIMKPNPAPLRKVIT